jgi:hypothetical protein
MYGGGEFVLNEQDQTFMFCLDSESWVVLYSSGFQRGVLTAPGYSKTSYGVCKTGKKIVLNSEWSWPDLGLDTGDQDVRAFD